LFLEQARTQRLIDSVREIGPLGNYFRPLSRQVYFELLTPIGGGQPLVFHLANFALFLGALALLADLLLALVAPAGAVAGCLLFALFPFQRVNTTWISCSQDLMALAGALGALALHRRGKRVAALLCYVAAIASKESALPLPAAVLAWDLLIERRPARDAMRRVAPFAVCGLIWIAIAVGRRWNAPPLPLHFDLEHFTAGYVHLVQSLLGLEHPAGMLASLASHPPAIVPLIALAAAAFVLAAPRPAKTVGAVSVAPAAGRAADRAGDTRARGEAAIGSVAHKPARPDTIAAARFAGYGSSPSAGHRPGGRDVELVLLHARRRRRRDLVGSRAATDRRLSWIALAAGLLWWHAGAPAPARSRSPIDPGSGPRTSPAITSSAAPPRPTRSRVSW
jgi:hypothetical protein